MTTAVIDCGKSLGMDDIDDMYADLLSLLAEDIQVSFDCSKIERIDTDKIDSLVNLVGELAITQSKLTQSAYDSRESMLPQLVGGLEQLEKHTREMQTQIL